MSEFTIGKIEQLKDEDVELDPKRVKDLQDQALCRVEDPECDSCQ